MPKSVGDYNIEIDFEQLDQLCNIQCTLNEIAHVMGCSEATIERRIKRETGKTFGAYWEEKSAGGKVSLRRNQYEMAMKGNVVMNIWLGKQWLEQKDKSENTENQNIRVVMIDRSNRPQRLKAIEVPALTNGSTD